MGDESYLGLRSVAVLLIVLGALYFVGGILDVEDYPIPGVWSVSAGLLMFVSAYNIWRLKPVPRLPADIRPSVNSRLVSDLRVVF